jgi:hypothetical protein
MGSPKATVGPVAPSAVTMTLIVMVAAALTTTIKNTATSPLMAESRRMSKLRETTCEGEMTILVLLHHTGMIAKDAMMLLPTRATIQDMVASDVTTALPT